MEKRILILALAVLLSVPLAAQQAAQQPNDQAAPAQPSAAQQPAQTQQADEHDHFSPHQPLEPERREGFWGRLNPFARKKYVSRQMEPVRSRVAELDELTAANARAIKDLDTRAQQGIRQADEKATQADRRAAEAGQKAQVAHHTAQQATTRLQTVEQVLENINQYQVITQAEIRFRPGQSTLSARAKEALDMMAEPLKNDKGYVLEVQGFSPGQGRAAVENSQRIAQAVARYLVLTHDIPVYRVFAVGMGNVPYTDENGRTQRTRSNRVEVNLLRNNIDKLGSASETAAAQPQQ